MPGPYAHITLLHQLMRPGRLESVFSPASGFCAVVEQYFPYCTLGAVSPDYPNLAENGTAAGWADAMHCIRACGMITSGIRCIRGAHGDVRDKQLAWFLGYVGHVVTDVTIHPIVQAKVGAYAENQRRHRICEMHQDSHIYRRMNLGEIGEADLFAAGVAHCSNFSDHMQLDTDIATLWNTMLADVHPELFDRCPPDIDAWHREFSAMVAGCANDRIRLFPLAGVIAAKMGLAYPLFADVDRQFIEKQTVPSGKPDYLHYDAIFDHAADTVAAVWKQVERAVCSVKTPSLSAFGEWNLDTGRDEQGNLVFWK